MDKQVNFYVYLSDNIEELLNKTIYLKVNLIMPDMGIAFNPYPNKNNKPFVFWKFFQFIDKNSLSEFYQTIIHTSNFNMIIKRWV